MSARLARRPALLAAAALVVTGCVLLGPSLFGGRALSAGDRLGFGAPFRTPLERPSNIALSDAVDVFHPELRYSRRAVLDLRLPAWDPYAGAGRPLLATLQSAPLLPLNWPVFVLPFWLGIAVVALLKTLLAGGGTYLLARRLGLHPAGALLGGLGVAFGTCFVAWLQFPHTTVLALLPFLMLAVDRLVTRDRLGDVLAVVALVALLVLAGHPETLAACLCLAVAFGVFRLLSAGRSDRRRAILLGGGALVWGVAIAAVTLGPFLELVAQSNRLTRYEPPLSLEAMRSLWFPERWGRGDKVQFEPAYEHRFASQLLYLGAVPVLLAGIAVVRDRRAVIRFFAVAAGVGVLLGFDTLFSQGLSELPGLSLVNPLYFLWPTVLTGGLLAAAGLDHLLSADAVERRRCLYVVAAGSVLPLALAAPLLGGSADLAGALAQIPTIDRGERDLDTVQLAGVLRWALLAAVAAGALWMLSRQRRVVLPLLAILTAADLLLVGWGFNPQARVALADPEPTASLRFLAAATHDRAIGVRDAVLPNVSDRYRFRDARVHMLPRVARYNRLFRALGGEGGPVGDHLTLYRSRKRPPREPLLEAFGVRYVLDDGRSVLPRHWRTVVQGPVERVLERPGARRAWLAHAWRAASDIETALQLARASSADDLREEPIVEGAPARTGTRTPVTPVRFVRDDPHEVVLRVDAPRPGRVVLTDAVYPGWKAQVDGRDAPILATNVATRSVAVPAGRHEVRFRYAPGSLRAGIVVSGGALAALLAAALWARRRRRVLSAGA